MQLYQFERIYSQMEKEFGKIKKFFLSMAKIPSSALKKNYLITSNAMKLFLAPEKALSRITITF